MGVCVDIEKNALHAVFTSYESDGWEVDFENYTMETSIPRTRDNGILLSCSVDRADGRLEATLGGGVGNLLPLSVPARRFLDYLIESCNGGGNTVVEWKESGILIISHSIPVEIPMSYRHSRQFFEFTSDTLAEWFQFFCSCAWALEIYARLHKNGQRIPKHWTHEHILSLCLLNKMVS